MSTAPSHIQRLLLAIDRLPDEARSLMNALYRQGMTDEQACQHFRLDISALNARRSSALQSLMSAVH